MVMNIKELTEEGIEQSNQNFLRVLRGNLVPMMSWNYAVSIELPVNRQMREENNSESFKIAVRDAISD